MFSPLASSLIKYILQDAVDELIIINDGKTYTFNEQQQLQLQERFKDPYREKLFNENTMERIDVAMERMIFVKLGNDISNLRKILSETLTELSDNSTFTTLKQTLEEVKHADQDEYQLIVDCIKHKKMMTKLEETFKSEAILFQQQEKVLDEQIYDLGNQLEDIKIENKIKLSFVGNWVKSRQAEAELALKKQNEKLITEIVKSEEQQTDEILTADNMQKFINNSLVKLGQKTEFWMEKYVADCDDYDRNIETTIDKIEKLQQESIDLNVLYLARDEEIENYLEVKRYKAKLAALAKNQWDSATKIQAWWRGTMIRKQLGPYKKKKGKKGKAK